jgi:hypothetical protein
MATHTNVPQSLFHSKSALVFPFSVQAITQRELFAILTIRDRLSQVETKIESAEVPIKGLSGEWCPVGLSDHIAELKINSGRDLAWKDASIRAKHITAKLGTL